MILALRQLGGLLAVRHLRRFSAVFRALGRLLPLGGLRPILRKFHPLRRLNIHTAGPASAEAAAGVPGVLLDCSVHLVL